MYIFVIKNKMSLARNLSNLARGKKQNDDVINNILCKLTNSIIDTVKSDNCVWTDDFNKVSVTIDIDIPRNLDILLTPDGMEYEETMIIFNPKHIKKLENILKSSGFSIKKISVHTRQQLEILLDIK